MKGCEHDHTLMQDECSCMTVNEGVALFRAWCRYLGVDDFTTVVVDSKFAAGYRAAIRDTRKAGESTSKT